MRNFLTYTQDQSLYDAVYQVVCNRPQPLREYDQIHMRIEDLALHLTLIADTTYNKTVIFVGDSDGVALSLAYAGHLGLIQSPKKCIIYDFDERIINFVKNFSFQHNFSDQIEGYLYNIFDPLPIKSIIKGDIFHINPPYGQYNDGKSIFAFLERSIAIVKQSGEGIIVLANDLDYNWSQIVLRNTLQELISRNITPYRIIDNLHHYLLDDQPDLESGIIFCKDIDPQNAIPLNESLPLRYKEKFYNRNDNENTNFPHYIRCEGDQFRIDF
jgi:N4-bis(aminopropyl)spermidine synthase